MPASMLLAAAHPLATLNACLNALAGVLLVVGLILIKRRREQAHKNVMLAAFVVSAAFLVSYVAYHLQAGSVKFAGPVAVRNYFYWPLLLTHVVLAACVPVLAIWTIVLGLKDRREKHRRLARWTFPIWLYVSVTGVLIYVVLYHVYPAP
ncbi:MAG: DUF420 domain-containing protein [Pirellulales bacterium]